MEVSIQDKFYPENRCFGCGPANSKGLQIKSFPIDKRSIKAEWYARKEHEAWQGVLNGGIVCTLLDCNGNWCAAWFVMNEDNLSKPPNTVTAEIKVKLLKPTPSNEKIIIINRATERKGRKIKVEGEIQREDGKITAKMEGIFVVVEKGFVR